MTAQPCQPRQPTNLHSICYPRRRRTVLRLLEFSATLRINALKAAYGGAGPVSEERRLGRQARRRPTCERELHLDDRGENCSHYTGQTILNPIAYE